MILNDLKNKKIAILGLGLENQALVKYLLKHKVKCEITVCDARKNVKSKIKNFWIPSPPARTTQSGGLSRGLKAAGMTNIKWQLGKNFNQGLEKFDILFRSPGWPIDCSGIAEARKKNLPLCPLVKGDGMLSSPMKLFFDLCPSKNIIGVTGTKGKGTTASLIYEILRAAGKRVWLGGNIGVAPFEFTDKIKKNDWVILELSSFQLEDMPKSPRIAVITNFYREHLAAADPRNPNYHKTLKKYWEAKRNIVKWQNKNEFSIFNFQFSNNFQFFNFQTKSKTIYFKKSELPSKLIGEHNKENIAAAIAVAKVVGAADDTIKKAVAAFQGLPHRLEFVRELEGVKYYDDSFATTPESTITALKSFAVPLILLLGGADKGADFKKLVQEVKNRVKFIVLLEGQATARIKRELLKAGFKSEKIELARSMKEAVAKSCRQAQPGQVVLLSPACASFGLFKNYKERGDLFKKEVLRLKT